MAIADDKLKNFFNKQKVGAFSALTQKGKAIVSPIKSETITDTQIHKSSDEKENLNNPLANDSFSVSKYTQTESTDSNILIEKSIKTITYPRIDKPLAINKQSVSEPLELREHTVVSSLADQKQPVSISKANSERFVSKPEAEPLADSLANEKFNMNLPVSEIDIHLSVFSAKERDLLNLIFWQCHNNCSLISPSISTEEIRNELKISPERVRNLIFRIIKKGGVESVMYKSGQNACRVFRLSRFLYQNLLNDLHRKQMKFTNTLANSLAEPLASNTYSSNFNNITTTNEIDSFDENLDWAKIDIEPLQEIGFTRNHLKQLCEKKLNTPEAIQESIYHFAYGIKNSPKTAAYQEPLTVLMGVLRKGQVWIESKYESPKIIALKQIAEAKKREKEQRDKIMDEIVEVEYPEWRRKLTDERLNQIVPKGVKENDYTGAQIDEYLKKHFKDKILAEEYMN